MATAEDLRRDLNAGKLARNLAQVVNAEASDAGRPEPFDDIDRAAFRRLVHELAAKARQQGVDISDLVAGDVGLGEFHA